MSCHVTAGSCSSVGLRTVLSGEVYRALHDVSLASDAVRYRVLQVRADSGHTHVYT